MKRLVFHIGLLVALNTAWAADVVVESEVTDSAVNISHALQGKRLFFAPQERTPADTTSGDSADSSVADKQDDVPAPTTDQRLMTREDEGKAHADNTLAPIRYDARVWTNTSFFIIINGIPCDPVDRSMFLVQAAEQVLSCSSSTAQGLQLLLLKDGKSIRVSRRTVSLGVLVPGQAL